ncbi:hypothetical protein PLESTB_001245900 [Pleodorina starrii]|uniref:Uncharacterized protein n=1 Tax=Pleodorina starrii TaxID=330485 RepID=A0A9W6BSF0_9CHLO|nr:hypothetical protein PLESTM_000213900 [Pleodorina starrii]GLC57611.1 hypothetical protein PLESTB_001245900 [Pleodorina starrii]GLC63280.1 hypothetical protein PLESTF_000019600 [Pleodorina starrii]
MDANMMKFAMEQMRKMNPEQLQEMMRNMPSDAMGQAMAQMKDMRPEDWERAKQQMESMGPDAIAQQAAQAQAQLAGRTQYVLNASNQLKAEGNQLHGRGAYKEAVEKYERAKSNVESFTGKEAKDLARACTLNLSSCYLNLKQYDKCVEQCNQVLSAEADNLKALYRRGQAYLGSGDCVSAAADLERALRLTLEADPSQAQPIREKLQEAKDQVGALRAAGKLPPAGAASSSSKAALAQPAAAADGAKASAPLGSAEARAASAAAPAAASGGNGTSGATSSGRPGPDPEMMARASEMFRSNPDMLKQAQDMMRGMSDEQLRGMARQMGVDVSPEVMRGGLGNMDPEVMAKVAQLQAELPPDLRGAEAARNPENMKRLADLMAKKPEMAATMGQMLSSLEPEKLQEMSRAAGLPPGMTITPEMAKAAAESFKNMSPQEVQEAIQTVTKMQQQQPSVPAAASSSSRASSTAAASTSGRDAAADASPASALPVAGMPPVDPRVAADMLAAMSPEQLASMSKMVPGMEQVQLTPEMAKMAAEMMKGMTAEDVARMHEMAAAMQGAGRGAAAAASGSGAGSAGMAAAAAAAGGFSPEMATAASEMMKNMRPEDISRMQEMAAKMGMGGAAGPAGMPGAGPDGGMSAMLSDPKMIESAVRMMKSMDPEAMASMMVSSGMCRDRAQAEAMARQMSSLTDTQLNMMVRTATAVQSARAAGGRALAWARANAWLVAALIVLVLALLLRWLGYM